MTPCGKYCCNRPLPFSLVPRCQGSAAHKSRSHFDDDNPDEYVPQSVLETNSLHNFSSTKQPASSCFDSGNGAIVVAAPHGVAETAAQPWNYAGHEDSFDFTQYPDRAYPVYPINLDYAAGARITSATRPECHPALRAGSGAPAGCLWSVPPVWPWFPPCPDGGHFPRGVH